MKRVLLALLLGVAACRTPGSSATLDSPVPENHPDILAFRGYFSQRPFDVPPYGAHKPHWDAMAAAMEPTAPDLAAWTAQRPAVLAAVHGLMGELPPRPETPIVTMLRDEQQPGFKLVRFELDNGVDAKIPGRLLVPDGPGRKPLIHYMHYDGAEYHVGKREIFQRGWPVPGTIAENLTRRGYAVLIIDAYAFGERQSKVPDRPELNKLAERDWFERSHRARGRSLWGMMMRDDQIALDWAMTRPEVDTNRIATLGMSMGSKRAFWMAAIDDRVTAVVSVAALPAFQEAAAALVAPRPFLTLNGDRDEFTPAADLTRVNGTLARIYGLYGVSGAFRSVVYPNVPHDFTPAMWNESLAWLDRWLRNLPQ